MTTTPESPAVTPEELANKVVFDLNSGSITAANVRAVCQSLLDISAAYRGAEQLWEKQAADAEAKLAKAHASNLQLVGVLETIEKQCDLIRYDPIMPKRSKHSDIIYRILNATVAALSGDDIEKWKELLSVVSKFVRYEANAPDIEKAYAAIFPDAVIGPAALDLKTNKAVKAAALQSGEPTTKEEE